MGDDVQAILMGLIEPWLRANGCDGLVWPEYPGCGCAGEMPCDDSACFLAECVPAYQVKQEKGAEFDFVCYPKEGEPFSNKSILEILTDGPLQEYMAANGFVCVIRDSPDMPCTCDGRCVDKDGERCQDLSDCCIVEVHQ